jgi:hypothetical protein
MKCAKRSLGEGPWQRQGTRTGGLYELGKGQKAAAHDVEYTSGTGVQRGVEHHTSVLRVQGLPERIEPHERGHHRALKESRQRIVQLRPQQGSQTQDQHVGARPPGAKNPHFALHLPFVFDEAAARASMQRRAFVQ